MITIGIIEDDRILRASIVDFINMDKSLSVTFSCSSIEKWIAHVEHDVDIPNILFLDLGLPGVSGLKAISIIKKTYPDTLLIVISGDSSIESIWEALSSGANGYLMKPFSLPQLREQIEIIKSGGAVLSPNIAEKLIRNIHPKDTPTLMSQILTLRQNEVLELLLKGLTYKEISNLLVISTATVNDHIKKIYLKMEVNSKAELLAKYLKAGQ
jgi:DNA-binding NarL/FixJ family response regulator